MGPRRSRADSSVDSVAADPLFRSAQEVVATSPPSPSGNDRRLAFAYSIMRDLMKPVLVLGAFALAALNAPTASAQQRPPIRQIGAVIAKSSDSLTSIAGVRALSDGRLLVNDIQGRRVLLLDATLKTAVVVADSTSATGNAYGGRLGGLIAYRGDSTLFVDPFSSSMLVIEPMGKIGRVMSIPRTQDAAMLANPSVGAPGFDTKGRLVYRQFPSIRPPAFGPNGITGPPAIPESTAIVRVDLATRQLDTVGFAKIPKIKMDMQVTENGGVRISTLNNPLPIVDDWAILPDGSVAFIRGTDYHVDFVNADGTRTSAPKIPFDWQRLTDDDKVAFIDSVKAARARLVASLPAGGAGPAGVIGGLTGGGGTPQSVIQGGPGAGDRKS